MAAHSSQGSILRGPFRISFVRRDVLLPLLVSLLSMVCFVMAASPNQDKAVVGDPTVYDMLARFGLPQGLLPTNVLSYDLKPSGRFTVSLGHECETQIYNNEITVHYAETITGVVKYGHLSRLKGIKAKMDSWIRITGIQISSTASGKIIFKIGVFAKMLETTEFDSPRPCIEAKSMSDSEGSEEGDNVDDTAEEMAMADFEDTEVGSQDDKVGYTGHELTDSNTFIS